MPFRLEGAKWALPVEETKETEDVLEGLPGIHWAKSDQRVEGMADGIAAVAFRLGRPSPPAADELVKVLPIRPELQDRGLREYQQRGITALREITKYVGGAILADDMGLGKTRQAIEYVESFGSGARALVVCPGAVRETWRSELQKWGRGELAVLHPGKSKADRRAWEEAKEARWVISSYELAEKAYETAFEWSPPSVLIMDEAHMLCGRKSNRSERLNEISMMVPYKLALTGTPMWSRPRDFWKLLRVLFGQRFGTKTQFDERYCAGHVNEYGGWINKGCTEADELKLRVSYYMIRREREEVLTELPPMERQVVWIDPPVEAERAFQTAMLKRTGENLWLALEATLAAKIQPVMEYAAQAKRFLLFTWMKSHAHQMSEVLAKEMDTPCVCITGDDTVKQRQAKIALAREKKIGVVATIDSAGVGMDGLQHVTSLGIMHAFDYVPLKMLQAEARLHRMGQTNGVHWTYFACKDSMDQLVIQTVVEKLDSFRKTMGKRVDRKELSDVLSVGQYGGDEKVAMKAIYDAMEG